jgi:hypothetical protein
MVLSIDILQQAVAVDVDGAEIEPLLSEAESTGGESDV